MLLGVTEPLLVRFSGADPGFFLRGEDAPLRYGTLTDWWRDVPNYHFYGVSHKFFNLVSCFTSTLTNHTVFFAHVISGRGGGAHSLHPSPRSPCFCSGMVIVCCFIKLLYYVILWSHLSATPGKFLFGKPTSLRTSGPRKHLSEHLNSSIAIRSLLSLNHVHLLEYRKFIFFTISFLVTIGSLSNDNGDGSENGKKAVGLDRQNNNFARASRFLVHFFAVTTRLYHMKVPNFTFFGGPENSRETFLFFSSISIQSFIINSRKICEHLTNWTRWNKLDKVWSSAYSLVKWRFRCHPRRCCLSSLITEVFILEKQSCFSILERRYVKGAR